MTRSGRPSAGALLPLLMFIPALAVASTASVAGDAARYDIVPAPGWVEALGVPDAPLAPAAGASGRGREFRLIDRQIRVDGGSMQYTRIVVALLNASGVNDASSITINFDPEHERLHLHAVTLHRGRELIDELKNGRIELLQRESGLEDNVLDGTLTFHLLLSDVRVGDVLDYSYTLERSDPEWSNRFFGRYLMRWETPVRHARLRVLTRVGAPLFVLDPDHGASTRRIDGDWQSLEWRADDLPGIDPEDGTPSGYEQYKSIQFSQFADWHALVEAAMPLYAATDAATPELEALTARFKATGFSDAERTLAVIRFVQEEVRYTAIELGAGAYRPTAPSEVLSRRYGDCKDKALLAVTLLRHLGIDAAPALVSTRWPGHVAALLPSPAAFDHAIVRVRIAGVTYWLDATATGQGGNLERYTSGEFGAALVLAPGVTDLESIPVEEAPEPLVAATCLFDLRAGLDHDSKLSIATRYRGNEADRMRRTLRRTTIEELSAQYLNYYERRYTGVHVAAPLQVEDDPRSDELTINENYDVEHLFTTDQRKQVFELDAEMINEHLAAPSTPVRTTPLALENPLNVLEQIEIRLPEGFPVKDEVQSIQAASFEYESRVSHAGNDVYLEYRYRTMADQVPVDQLADFLQKRDAARADTYFSFSYAPVAGPTAVEIKQAAEALRQAWQLAKAGKSGEADTALTALIASPGFGGLTSADQHGALFLAGALAVDDQDFARALTLLQRSSVLPEAIDQDWALRLQVAVRVDDRTDAALSLTSYAQRWPDRLSALDARLIARVVHLAPSAGEDRYRLLKALLDAKYHSDGVDPSRWWRDLALLQLERGERAEASATLAAVTDAYTLISILSDNRFASIRAVQPAALDVEAVAERQIAAVRAEAQRRSDELDPVVRLTNLLLSSLRFDEALRATDAVISRVNGPNGTMAYSDYNRSYVWILDNRSRALQGLGRWEEAVATELAASHLPEQGTNNVSQVINLAGLYNDLAQPDAAREVLGVMATRETSAYGRMQVESARLGSAVQLGDAAQVEQSLAYLKAHQEDSVATYQRGLIDADREEEAAQLLIARLADPDERIDALMEVQQYGQMPLGVRAQELEHRRQMLLARPDVRAAIASVGTVGTYRMMPDIH